MRVGVRAERGETRLAQLFQQGSAKAMLPRVHRPDPDVVLLNTAGGLTGGDRFEYRLEAEAGARLTAVTQTAERVYRSTGDAAEVSVHLTVGAGGRVDWLAQETILFEGGRLRRRIEADIAADAELLLVEPVIFGRTAMGEVVRSGHLSDQWRIRRDGALIFAEASRFDGDIEALTQHPAGLAGGCAMATMFYAAPDAEARLAPARDLLSGIEGWTAGASLLPGGLVIRAIARNGVQLRSAMLRFLPKFRGSPLPRVWTM